MMKNISTGLLGRSNLLNSITKGSVNSLATSKRFGSSGPQLPKFDYSLSHCNSKPPAYKGPSKEQVLKDRKEFLTPALLTYYPNNPIMIGKQIYLFSNLQVDGKMQYLFDEKGTRYLDMFAGIVTVSVGHCHPYVTQKAKEQMDALQHTTTIYLHPNIAEFGKKLASNFPPESGLKVCYFMNSGSEANDLAVLMAREYTGNYEVVAMRNGYHGGAGNGLGLTSLHTWKYRTPGDFGIKHTENPNLFRGRWRANDPDAAKKYAEQLKELIEFDTSGQVAAFIAEPIQGIGGSVEIAEGYLKEAYAIIRKHGGLCISDEVQTGFGRTGTNYWGFQNSGVYPDIVVTAKGIGNGTPLACVITKPEIAQALTKRIHFNTFGGNPGFAFWLVNIVVASAIGSAVLDVIKKENIQQNAHVVGTYLKDRLKELQKRFPIMGDVRGKGLMLGVEFVRDLKTLEPAREETQKILERLRDFGTLVGKGGLYGNCLRIKPPMCINKADADFFVDCLEIVLKEVAPAK